METRVGSVAVTTVTTALDVSVVSKMEVAVTTMAVVGTVAGAV